ncbi:MAG: hypothetical protein FWE58_04530 [Methanobrevibacter sp.]|nr:hypothetical protein [Methanobrevibacter sp.]
MRNVEMIHGNYIKSRKSKKGWAIVIIPPHARIDNFHGYSHIHFTPTGKKHKIIEMDFDMLYEIIRTHLKKNKKLIKEELLEVLS